MPKKYSQQSSLSINGSIENILLAYTEFGIVYRTHNGLHRTEVPAGYVQRFGGKNLAKLDMASRFFPTLHACRLTLLIEKARQFQHSYCHRHFMKGFGTSNRRYQKDFFLQKEIICQYERKRDGTAAPA